MAICVETSHSRFHGGLPYDAVCGQAIIPLEGHYCIPRSRTENSVGGNLRNTGIVVRNIAQPSLQRADIPTEIALPQRCTGIRRAAGRGARQLHHQFQIDFIQFVPSGFSHNAVLRKIKLTLKGSNRVGGFWSVYTVNVHRGHRLIKRINCTQIKLYNRNAQTGGPFFQYIAGIRARVGREVFIFRPQFRQFGHGDIDI